MIENPWRPHWQNYMNTKLYKQVYTLAGELLKAAETGENAQFGLLYEQLRAICYDNEADERKNHPVQWETLADFTEDSSEALAIYGKALGYAQTINADEYLASISYAMALLLTEVTALDEHNEKALAIAQQASQYALKIRDSELQKEIADLLKTLQH
jgi:hypothetical protein